jgi:hypothetical protein
VEDRFFFLITIQLPTTSRIDLVAFDLKYNSATMADMMFALGQTKKKKTEENKVRQTKKDLKDVNITETIEKDIRKEQHDREKNWKATGRDQIKQNTKFDMARSLFGGGGPAPEPESEEEEVVEEIVEEIVEEVEQLTVNDGEGEEEVEEEEEEEEE